MNQHKASEQAAAAIIRSHAVYLAAAYTEDPQDLAASRLALLMQATEDEARAQGFHSRVIFDIGGEE